MLAMLMVDSFGTVIHGGVIPLVWIVGIVLLIAGVVTLIRGGVALGIVLIILGILLGGLNVV